MFRKGKLTFGRNDIFPGGEGSHLKLIVPKHLETHLCGAKRKGQPHSNGWNTSRCPRINISREEAISNRRTSVGTTSPAMTQLQSSKLRSKACSCRQPKHRALSPRCTGPWLLAQSRAMRMWPCNQPKMTPRMGARTPATSHRRMHWIGGPLRDAQYTRTLQPILFGDRAACD